MPYQTLHVKFIIKEMIFAVFKRRQNIKKGAPLPMRLLLFTIFYQPEPIANS
jgi:hypothetical protein